MNFIEFETLVENYIKTNDNYDFINILNALKGYTITVATNTKLKHYDYDDIIQELEFTIFKALSKYDTNSNKAWGYLTTCIKHRMYQLYANDNKLSTLESNLLNNTENNSAFTDIDFNIIEQYRTSNLTDIEFTILSLYYVDMLSISHIASKLNKSNSYITKKKRSALKKISCCNS